MNRFNNMPETYRNRTAIGIVLVLLGIVFIGRQLFFFPGWLFSWPMILIGIGLYSGMRHNFQNRSWFIFVLLGAIFLFDGWLPGFYFHHLLWPVGLIVIGLYMLLRHNSLDRFGRPRF